MDIDLKSWWDLAQLAGAGATFVLGPATLLLWKQHVHDIRYIRDADKNTLTILSELSTHLTSSKDAAEQRQLAVMAEVRHLRDMLSLQKGKLE